MCVAVTTSTASVLSFLVFWLVLGENMKEHLIFGHKVYVAPVYLICIILGSAGLVYVTRTSRSGTAASRQASVGLLLAVLAGGFSAVQYGAVNLGRRSAMRAIGCDEEKSDWEGDGPKENGVVLWHTERSCCMYVNGHHETHHGSGRRPEDASGIEVGERIA
eukprot:g10953.t1